MTAPARSLAAALVALAACADNAALLDAGARLPELAPDVVVNDVPAPQDVLFTDSALPTSDTAPEPAPLGATPVDGGVRFRVWAPGATAARVVGAFPAAALTRGADGVFEGTAPGARVGDGYRYELTRGAATLSRVDPRARRLDADGGVVTGPVTYPWRAGDFRPPALREAVLYELHVGSFDRAAGAAHGTFADVTARLDQLADLGVNVLQLMPVNDFGNGARWGYNPQHWHAPGLRVPRRPAAARRRGPRPWRRGARGPRLQPL